MNFAMSLCHVQYMPVYERALDITMSLSLSLLPFLISLPASFLSPRQYLREALTPFICFLLEMEDDCEVDPMKMSQSASLQHNQAALTRLVRKAWNDILYSYTKFPRCV